jgi:C-terminal processing protease CtpA/Prc
MFLKKNLAIAVFAVAAYIGMPHPAVGQQPQAPPDKTIDAATRTAVIDNLIKELNDGYVFPEMAKKLEADLRKRQASKEFDSITSAQAFSKKLTDDIQAISKDKHLRVRFSAQPIPVRTDRREPTEAEKEQNRWFTRRINYGFERVERMNGNIGYIDLRGFSDHEAGAETVAAAMKFLENTESIIFDLRQNGGGSPFMVALISTYLFGDKPVHLNSLYFRPANTTDDFWTKPELAKVKFPNKDVYILTANRTFSAAEEFTYNLKNLKRATIVGETTGGGAHPGGPARLHEHFNVFIPSGRAINPITKTNWEGTGVEPDIKVPKEQALKVAYLAALKKSLSNIKDENVKNGVKQLIDETQRELDGLIASLQK